MTNNLEAFLKETEFCDYKHPSIQAIAGSYSRKYKDKKELAKNLFYFVRDHIHYSVGNWQDKASETLYKRHGTCTNSANLLVALLRAVGIPSGYGIFKVHGQKYFGPIALSKISKRVSAKSTHVHCYVYLDKKWIKCDPSDDEILSINTQHLNPQSSVIDWDGSTDAILKLEPEHILFTSEPKEDIEHLFRKKQRKSLWFAVRIGNLYIKFLRHNGSGINSMEQSQKEFNRWLKERYFFDYLLYNIIDAVA